MAPKVLFTLLANPSVNIHVIRAQGFDSVLQNYKAILITVGRFWTFMNRMVLKEHIYIYIYVQKQT